MTIAFRSNQGGRAGWRGDIGKIAVFVDDANGAPDPEQVALAELIAGKLDGAKAQAAAYLDLFVDRSKSCGKADENWWLDEIEMRGLKRDPQTCHFYFDLDGDDGGLWTVEIVFRHNQFWPVRFERRQG